MTLLNFIYKISGISNLTQLVKIPGTALKFTVKNDDHTKLHIYMYIYIYIKYLHMFYTKNGDEAYIELSTECEGRLPTLDTGFVNQIFSALWQGLANSSPPPPKKKTRNRLKILGARTVT